MSYVVPPLNGAKLLIDACFVTSVRWFVRSSSGVRTQAEVWSALSHDVTMATRGSTSLATQHSTRAATVDLR